MGAYVLRKIFARTKDKQKKKEIKKDVIQMKKMICMLIALLLLATPAAAAPSDWATAEIEAARATGTMAIHPNFEETWQENTTRAEFAWMAVQLMRLTLGYSEEELRAYVDSVEYTVASYTTDEALFAGEKTGAAAFTDTDDPYVLLAADIGIVQGRGDGIFDPYGAVTRQEAAVMLLRTYAAYSYSLSFQPKNEYADAAGIASWANLAVRFVTKNGVMQGVGDNQFAPSAAYTHEQTVLTFLRLTGLEGWQGNPGLFKAKTA